MKIKDRVQTVQLKQRYFSVTDYRRDGSIRTFVVQAICHNTQRAFGISKLLYTTDKYRKAGTSRETTLDLKSLVSYRWTLVPYKVPQDQEMEMAA